ncbi:MAG: 23S rRNA (adenine(2503)-C(2))-methyltransferase RlmN [Phycisphaerales bacterium]
MTPAHDDNSPHADHPADRRDERADDAVQAGHSADATELPELIGCTLEQAIEFAAAAGRPAGSARHAYRTLFRTGELPRSTTWATTVERPIVRRHEEGVTTKFAQRLTPNPEDARIRPARLVPADDADGRAHTGGTARVDASASGGATAPTRASGTAPAPAPAIPALETESVILPQRSRGHRDRISLCVSSQVGCAMGCGFCETAQMGRLRQLTPAEIVAQWFAARHEFGTPIDNIVFMGMGEPMDNLDAVLPAIEILTGHDGPAIAASRITVSTVGHAAGIRRLADFAATPGRRRLNLAVSVNAPNDEIRDALMPINRGTPLDELMDAMRHWVTNVGARILVEYVLIPGVNAELEHADELVAQLGDLPATINIIPYNPRRDSPWPAPTEPQVVAFVDRIAARGRLVKRRRTMGRSVMGACGQLGNPEIRQRRFVPLGTGG